MHINLETLNTREFTVAELPPVRVINRVCYLDPFPQLASERTGIFVGKHRIWTKKLTELVDSFCEKYNAVVFCDQTSNYHGKYGIWPYIVTAQSQYSSPLATMDTLIHIGKISGSYISLNPKKVWRVNPDGEVRDPFHKLTTVFEMDEEHFFEAINAKMRKKKEPEFFYKWKDEVTSIRQMIPELPFSNAWIAQKTLPKIPDNSCLLVGILNTLRNWNFYDAPTTVSGYSNTGGFGIDGLSSTIIGVSLSNPQKLCYAVIGDLAFFYDINSLGNRHVGNNVRIMIINNGLGVEFRNYGHPCSEFGEDANPFMAAAGHFGKQSATLVRNYAESLGYRYLSASNKAC